MGRYCFVPGCKEGYASKRAENKLTGTKNKAIFNAPEDSLLLEKWNMAIHNSIKKLRPKIDYVCEQHFDEECLIRYFETKMPDGTIHRIKRDRVSLKSDAVPSIFPNLPQNVKKKKKKAPCDQVLKSKNSNNFDNVSEEQAIYNTKPSFSDLECKLKTIPLPNEQWFFSRVGKSFVFGELSSNQNIGKEIVISEELTIQVFLNKKPFIITPTILSIGDISSIIKTIDCLKLCEGTGIDNCLKADSCFGYVENAKQMCTECAKKKELLMDLQKIATMKKNEDKFDKSVTEQIVKNVTPKHKCLNHKVYYNKKLNR